jgi:hypothetical protein
MYRKLTKGGSYQGMDFMTRYGTQNDRERRSKVTGLASYAGHEFQSR